MKVKIEVNEYLLCDIVQTGGTKVKITRNLYNHYNRVTREFNKLQERLSVILEAVPKPPVDESWRYNLDDTDPAKLYPKEESK